MPIVTEPLPTDTDTSAGEPPEATPTPLRVRYRIRFAKTGLLRWISHRDLARLWERLLRRAQLRLSMTEGFHPKPRIGFPSALALGVEGLDEVVEIELAEELSPHELLRRLQDDNQPGLTIKRVCLLPEGFGKAQLLRSHYDITMPAAEDSQVTMDPETISGAIEELLSRSTVSIERKKKTMTVDVASQISDLRFHEGRLRLSLEASKSASLRPGDVLDLLGFADWIENGSLITRTQVVLENEFQSDEPSRVAVGNRPNQPPTGLGV